MSERRLRDLLRGKRWMLFVDGENFAKSGQRVLQSARYVAEAGAFWRRDVFLWAFEADQHWGAIEPFRSTSQMFGSTPIETGRVPDAELRRAYYYTSDDADEPEWTQTRLAIRDLGFEPRMFKRRRGRSKAVDVALAS